MECDGCTVCCDILPVPVLNKGAYERCVHCKSNMCLIHEMKPDFCKSFDCMYTQVEGIPIKLRPDKCGVVFEKVNDKVIYGIQHPDLELTTEAKRQAGKFIKQGFSVALKRKNVRLKIFLADGHKSKDIEKILINSLEVNGELRDRSN